MIDLKKIRLKANISQDRLALRLSESFKDITQTQISRYEDNPDSVPIALLEKWLKALGTSPEYEFARQEQSMDGGLFDKKELDINPYFSLNRNISLLKDYLKDTSKEFVKTLQGDLGNNSINNLYKAFKQKPNLVISGKFDVGKSFLANALMGGKFLPTDYTPTTKIINYIHHINDRPEWIKEDVWIMKEGFDYSKWNNKEYCEQNKIVAGNFETLIDYGTHGAKHEDAQSGSALVFIDSLILTVCNIIDHPGFDNDEEDKNKADSTINFMDILIYASPANGFLDAPDFQRLRYFLDFLYPAEKDNPNFPSLGNLFILATHADPSIKDEELSKICETNVGRIWREMSSNLKERTKNSNHILNDEELKIIIRSRIFTYWYENKNRRKDFEDNLKTTLSEYFPKVLENRSDKTLNDFKKVTNTIYQNQIIKYENVLKNLEAAKKQYEELKANEPQRKKIRDEKHAEVENKIDKYRGNELTKFSDYYRSVVNVNYIEHSIIEEVYTDDKKEASSHAPGYILNTLKKKIRDIIDPDTQNLKKDIEAFLESYKDTSLMKLEDSSTNVNVEIPFDYTGAFIGGMAGLTTIGALAVWASALGNLGGYIIIAQIVSLLSSIGISLGGTAATIAAISSIGGPITLGIGLAIIAVLSFWKLFGESWETRLAKKIVEVFKEKDVLLKYTENIKDYWESTKIAFNKGAEAVEEKYQQYLNNLKELISNQLTKEETEKKISSLREAQSFFSHIPWFYARRIV